PDLFSQFGRWFAKLVNHSVTNPSRTSSKALIPFAEAFIDDTKDWDIYPHIHAVVFIPSGSVRKFDKWVASGD
ncbi:hypothetical protein, partial [Streptococcus pneumoniae]|uniref:hypothetical protein n=1 Tax=Streptococcus pneumoniae TaxID=1313 RepID=UPI001954CCF7